MPFDEQLASRIRKLLARRKHVEEKRMFGGVAFIVRGYMVCGVSKKDLMVRVKLDRYPALLKKPHARKMTFTGRPLKGFLFVNLSGYKTQKGLEFWIDQALQFAKSQPLKL